MNSMRILSRRLTLIVLMALCLAPGALFATVRIGVTSPGTNVMGGVYVNPYTGTIDGVAAQFICDDFGDTIWPPEYWDANEYNVATLGADIAANGETRNMARLASLSIANAQSVYNQAAWLAIQLMASSSNTVRGQLSWAIWALFDGTGILSASRLGTANYNAIVGTGGWLDQAAAYASAPAGSFSNVYVYSPVAGTSTCPNRTGGVCPTTPPQELLLVRTPEAPALALLLLNLLAVLGAVLYTRNRRQRLLS